MSAQYQQNASQTTQPPVTKAALQAAIQRFSAGRVAVVGDFAIDEMVYGTTERLSREAPVVILRHHHTDTLLGAGANAAHNVAALGANTVKAVGVVGPDDYAPRLLGALTAANITTDGMVVDNDRVTTTKTRVSGMASQSVTQQIVRLDREDTQPLTGAVEAQLLAALEAAAGSADAILLSDYALGVVTDNVIARCRQLAQARNLVWTGDSHRELTLFNGATILTPNQPEAERNVGHALNTFAERLAGGQKLLESTGVQHLLLTLGGDGMLLFHRATVGQQANDAETLLATPIPVFNKSDVFDVTGAGDTVIGTLTLALATGASLLEAAVLGNLAASIVVRTFGTAVPSSSQLQDALAELPDAVLASINTRTIAHWQTQGQPAAPALFNPKRIPLQ